MADSWLRSASKRAIACPQREEGGRGQLTDRGPGRGRSRGWRWIGGGGWSSMASGPAIVAAASRHKAASDSWVWLAWWWLTSG